MEEQIEFTNPQGELLDGRLHLPEKPTDKVCIITHGFHSNKNLLWLHDIADALAEKGIAALRFDFSGHGDSEGHFTEFGFKKGAGDFAAALEVVKERGFKKIAALGHSIGAAVIMQNLCDHAEIRCFVDIAGPSRLDCEENEAFIRKIYEQADVKDGALLHELKDGDLFTDLGRSSVPTLIIHGSEDEIVPLEDSELILEALKGPKKLEIIEGGDHLLLKEAHRVIRLSVNWIVSYLK